METCCVGRVTPGRGSEQRCKRAAGSMAVASPRQSAAASCPAARTQQDHWPPARQGAWPPQGEQRHRQRQSSRALVAASAPGELQARLRGDIHVGQSHMWNGSYISGNNIRRAPKLAFVVASTSSELKARFVRWHACTGTTVADITAAASLATASGKLKARLGGGIRIRRAQSSPLWWHACAGTPVAEGTAAAPMTTS